MLLSLLLTFASLNPSSQVQAREYVTINVVNHVMLTRMYAVECVRRLNDPHWLRLYGPNRKTHQMIDDMLAKSQVELQVKIKEMNQRAQAKIKPGTNPYTLAEAMALAKAIRGLPPDQISVILTKFEAERESSTAKGVK